MKIKCYNCNKKFKIMYAKNYGNEYNITGVLVDENNKHLLCPGCRVGCSLEIYDENNK